MKIQLQYSDKPLQDLMLQDQMFEVLVMKRSQ